MITATSKEKGATKSSYIDCALALDEELRETVESLNMTEQVACDLGHNEEMSALTDRLVRMIVGDRPDILHAKAFASLEVVERVRSILNTYNVSPDLMEIYGLEDGWQDKIPDFVIQAIAEQTATVMRELDRGIVKQEAHVEKLPAPIKVFIVEDDAKLCDEFEKHLKENTLFTLVGTADGATKALELIKDTQPDVIILDYALNEKDGAACLKGIQDYFEVPPYIIGISAAKDKETID